VGIAAEVVRAIEHLHGLRPPMVHRDLKTANVLLDQSGHAKVADFGTVRAQGAQEKAEGASPRAAAKTHNSTRVIVGTQHYMPPEYTAHGFVSEKTDIYALAIVLLELLTGKVAAQVAGLHCEEPDLFAGACMQQYTDERAGVWPAAVVEGLAAVAGQCIAYHARARPTARELLPTLTELVDGRFASSPASSSA
jgi:serine/threonine protein kinase